MTTLDVLRTVVPAVLRSGLVKPIGPQAIWQIVRATGRGANPAILLAIGAARWPQRAALIDDAGPITYRELHATTHDLAGTLHNGHGVRPGVQVGVMCRNGRGFAQSVFAVAALGADVVLLNTDFNPVALDAALTSHRIGIVLCDSEFREILAAANPRVEIVDPAATTGTPRQPLPVAPPGRIVMLTSGTTAGPKGVGLSLRALLASARASRLHLGERADDRWLCLPSCTSRRSCVAAPRAAWRLHLHRQ